MAIRALSKIDMIFVFAGITRGVTTGVRVAVLMATGGRGMAAGQHIQKINNRHMADSIHSKLSTSSHHMEKMFTYSLIWQKFYLCLSED
jgi:hypothetical protein